MTGITIRRQYYKGWNFARVMAHRSRAADEDVRDDEDDDDDDDDGMK